MEVKMPIQEGNKVSLDYTVSVEGSVIDSSDDHGPLEYTHGQGKIIPGLADRLEGLKEGDEKSFEVPPKEAYGNPNPDAQKEFPKSSLPDDVEPKVDMLLQVQDTNGQTRPVKIKEVKDNSIVLDLNHPLAGKTLNFEVEVLSVD